MELIYRSISDTWLSCEKAMLRSSERSILSSSLEIRPIKFIEQVLLKIKRSRTSATL